MRLKFKVDLIKEAINKVFNNLVIDLNWSIFNLTERFLNLRASK